MIDKSIPYYNVIMLYDGPKVRDIPVTPKGFHYEPYREGDDERWAQMEIDNNDFDTYENALNYFRVKYKSQPVKLEERFIGVRDSEDVLRGCVMCWDDMKDDNIVSTVHWTITDIHTQGLGIGTFLIQMLVYKFSELNLLPIYLHTQPWSYTAISIYSNCGFRLTKRETFKSYINQTEAALPVLRRYLEIGKYNKLVREML